MVLTTLLLIPAAALGVAVAGKSAPLTFGWPSEHAAMLKQRMRMLLTRAPSRGQRLMAAAALGLLFSGGALVAYAAQPSAPDSLPSEAAGVVGSGDQLSLRLNSANGPRTLSIGQEYRDGWTLQALSPDVATLAKDGQLRRVGLNPDGVLALASADENSLISVVGSLAGKGVAGQAPGNGAKGQQSAPTQATVQDAARIAATKLRVQGSIAKAVQDARARGQSGVDLFAVRAEVGKGDFDAYLAARTPDEARADAVATNDTNAIRAVDGQTADGPETIYVAPGAGKLGAANGAGLLSISGYRLGPIQSDGSATLYRNGPGGASTVPGT